MKNIVKCQCWLLKEIKPELSNNQDFQADYIKMFLFKIYFVLCILLDLIYKNFKHISQMNIALSIWLSNKQSFNLIFWVCFLDCYCSSSGTSYLDNVKLWIKWHRTIVCAMPCVDLWPYVRETPAFIATMWFYFCEFREETTRPWWEASGKLEQRLPLGSWDRWQRGRKEFFGETLCISIRSVGTRCIHLWQLIELYTSITVGLCKLYLSRHKKCNW